MRGRGGREGHRGLAFLLPIALGLAAPGLASSLDAGAPDGTLRLVGSLPLHPALPSPDERTDVFSWSKDGASLAVRGERAIWVVATATPTLVRTVPASARAMAEWRFAAVEQEKNGLLRILDLTRDPPAAIRTIEPPDGGLPERVAASSDGAVVSYQPDCSVEVDRAGAPPVDLDDFDVCGVCGACSWGTITSSGRFVAWGWSHAGGGGRKFQDVRFQGHLGPDYSPGSVLSPDDGLILDTGRGDEICPHPGPNARPALVRATNGRRVFALALPRTTCNDQPGLAAAFSADSSFFAVALRRRVQLYAVGRSNPLAEVPVDRPVRQLSFSPRGDLLALASEGQVTIFRTR